MARGVCQNQAVIAGSSKRDTRATARLLGSRAARTAGGESNRCNVNRRGGRSGAAMV